MNKIRRFSYYFQVFSISFLMITSFVWISVSTENRNEFNLTDLIPSENAKDQILENLNPGKLDLLSFRKNIGQFSKNINYYLLQDTGGIGFGLSSLYFETDFGEFQLEFIGANPVSPVGINMIPTFENYFIGSTSFRNIPLYSQILYPDIYNGIDLRYFWSGDKLKYEFIVDPFTDFSRIKMEYSNIDSSLVQSDKIQIKKGDFTFRDEKLKIFYKDTKKSISGSFIPLDIAGSKSEQIGFIIDQNYDKSRTIVIDPYMISFSRFVGGSNFDDPYQIELDDEGFIYIAGFTSSTNFPGTENGYQKNNEGSNDIVVFKLSPDGSEIIFATYIGGSNSEMASNMVLDDENNIYLTGNTLSSNFPITENAFNKTYGGFITRPNSQWGGDAYVLKLSADGTNLLYSTYLGGSNSETGWGIAIDDSNNVYVTGSTSSKNFPVTDNSSMYGEGRFNFGDAFIAKLSADGSNLLFGSYLGGSNDDFGTDIILDSQNNIIISGGTHSTDFPTTSNSFDESYNGNETTNINRGSAFFGGDIFITKLSANGSSIFSTYIGGSGVDWPYELGIDDLDNIYSAGNTESSDFPVQNAFSSSYSGSSLGGGFDGGDGYLLKLTKEGDELIFSTYLGGNKADFIIGLRIGKDNKAYTTGLTLSEDFPITSDANFKNFSRLLDIFVTVFSQAGNSLEYSTYLGGISREWANRIAIDDENSIYIAGTSGSFDFPITCDPYNSSNSGGSDFVIVKFEISDTMDNSRLCVKETSTTTTKKGLSGFSITQLIISIIGILILRIQRSKKKKL